VKLARGQKVGVTAGYPILAAVSASPVPGVRQLGKVQVQVTPAPALPERMIALDGAVARAGPLLASVDLDGTLRVWKLGQKNHWVQLAGAGHAVEIADLDDDGKVELISSAARPAGFGDQLLIRSLRDDGTAKVAYRETTRGGIAAIGAGDLDGDGAVDVVAFVRELGQRKGELWLVR
jgi:hypothetical protein